MPSIQSVKTALLSSWSIKTSSLWTPNNPAAGQCGVTTLVVQDVLGGRILKTKYGDLWHYYNEIDGVRLDFTESQFTSPIEYDDIHATIEEAFSDTNQPQYDALTIAILKTLKTI